MATKLWGHGPDREDIRRRSYDTALDLILKLEGSGEFAESVHLREAFKLVRNAEMISRGVDPYPLGERDPRLGKVERITRVKA
jgi:hypothetical protein